jgi:HSP20 family protein
MGKYDWNPWEALGGAGAAPRRAPGRVAPGAPGAVREPPADVVETPSAYIIEMELPGVRREDIGLEASGREIVVFGTARQEKDAEGGVYLVMERAHGAFGRRFLLPRGLDARGVSAVFEAGLLTVTVPKRREAPGCMRIPVED